MSEALPDEIRPKVEALYHSAYASGVADACPTTGGEDMTARAKEADSARSALVSAILAYGDAARAQGREEAADDRRVLLRFCEASGDVLSRVLNGATMDDALRNAVVSMSQHATSHAERLRRILATVRPEPTAAEAIRSLRQGADSLIAAALRDLNAPALSPARPERTAPAPMLEFCEAGFGSFVCERRNGHEGQHFAWADGVARRWGPASASSPSRQDADKETNQPCVYCGGKDGLHRIDADCPYDGHVETP